MSQGTTAFVTSSYPFGDGESFLGPELERIAEQRRVVVVPVWPRGRARTLPPPLAGTAVAAHPAAPSVIGSAALECVRRPGAVLRALRRFLTGPPRTCLRNLAVVPKGLWLARLVRRDGIVHIHAYWAGIPATAAMLAAEVADVRWSMTAHRGDVLDPNLLRDKVAGATFTRCVADATAAVVGRALGEDSSLRDRVFVLHLGVRLPAGEPRSRAPLQPLTALCVAALSPRKGHDVLLDALARVRAGGVDLRLDLAGSGPSEEGLRAEVARRGLGEAVRFLGQVSHDDLLARYETSEVAMVVLASSSEGVPVSLMEAMAHGVPVIATDAGGTAELVGGGAGVLVEVGDVDALADAMASLASDPARRDQLTEAGRARVRSGFDAEACARGLLRAIDERSRP